MFKILKLFFLPFIKFRKVLLIPVLFFSATNFYANELKQSFFLSPFEILENDYKLEEKQLLIKYEKLNVNQRNEIENKLKEIYANLHNIRHYKAFKDLWEKLKWEKDKVTVLYPASGAHIAPFEIIHCGKIKEATFIFTEIDPLVIPRLEILLREMERIGFYKDIEINIYPLYEQFYKNKTINKNSSQEEIQSWIRDEIAKNSQAPPLEVIFSFKYKQSSVKLYLILNGISNGLGSTNLYRIEDFKKADLIITHDWSFDPRENLHLLKLFINSACAIKKDNIFIMIEDLENYPSPIDFKIFNVIGKTDFYYGHSSYFLLPNKKKLDFEGEFSLYGGGVILNPDLDFFCNLNEKEKNALFDLVIFKEYGFDRANYDIIEMKKIPAPPLLDLYTKYAYKNIEGDNITAEYFINIIENILYIMKKTENKLVKITLCNYIKKFKKTLKEMTDVSKREEKILIQDNSISNPFLIKEKAKVSLQKAKNNSQNIRNTLKRDAENSEKALIFLIKKQEIIKGACDAFDKELSND